VAASKRNFADAARYYGEDAAKTSKNTPLEPERFARVIKNFADLLTNARKDRRKVEAAVAGHRSPKDAAAAKTEEKTREETERKRLRARRRRVRANSRGGPARPRPPSSARTTS